MSHRGLFQVLAAANELLGIVEARRKKAKGLRHPRHARTIRPVRRTIEAILRRYWKRQEAALLQEVGPKIVPLGIVREASHNGKRAADALLPSSVVPLRFAVTSEEGSEYADAITTAIRGAAAALGKELGFTAVLSDNVVTNYLQVDSLTKLTGNFTDESVQRLRNAVADAWDRGGSYEDIVAAIKETFADFSDVRAGMIAQTEANDAYNYGRRQMAVEAGFDEKSWDPDGDACAKICQPNVEAGWIDINQLFPSGDMQPTAHPNCDCGIDFQSGGNK